MLPPYSSAPAVIRGDPRQNVERFYCARDKDGANPPSSRQCDLIQFYGKFYQAELPPGLRQFNSHTLTQSLESPNRA